MPVDPMTLRTRALTVQGVSEDVAALTCALVYLGDRIAEASERIAHPMGYAPGHVGPMAPCHEAQHEHAETRHGNGRQSA